MNANPQVIVVGAGIGGLVSAIELARGGARVLLLERAAQPGGKLREIEIEGQRLDAGPTVLTMRWVFDELFARAGSSLERHLRLRPARTLARHAWSAEERLDLHADVEASVDAIGRFAGAAEAQRYREFCARARRTYRALEKPFLRASRPNPISLVARSGLRGLPELLRISPFGTLWNALGQHFHDPRLRQLFGRYATYCGSSPFQAPATLMLVAHAEQQGVWLVDGGMQRLAQALTALARGLGVQLRCSTEVTGLVLERERVAGVLVADATTGDGGERIAADAVVFNGDASALAAGLLGAGLRGAARATRPQARSLSAMTWNLLADARDSFPLQRHNVFFSTDYAAEFKALRNGHMPAEPTVYVCAQDRDERGLAASHGVERLLCLINAPAGGDRQEFEPEEIARCEQRCFHRLSDCGLRLQRDPALTRITRPSDFNRLFPATGGALYGPASHGWMASFTRPGSRSRIAGLYLAGGSVHPGPGLPMAALSGHQAAASLLQDLASTRRWHPVAMPGGISTR
ncbi:1-hydroxycarotenoid 3,4-desaturase CrtD [Rivibacter subsaxonicus]|uniref:1-hydroxycarotenoid 3,4-desaturase n=1 Tax=Rivibacter subsaxonicus TaxID=457575 RepID=A0A4Q7W2H7_9BURK|nr:1-hydroxycarotenoid 3,4-desaturase CrtD [Rivibacter subsaxonicus]RZU02849.1 1-hydroxycarotenoid 3,4-desaturase [Rivibacter subsaxonicus]